MNSKSGYLFGGGIKPRIVTCDGWETPVPLRIDVQYGDAEIEKVARDILGLTKLNYNACRLGDNQPVSTIGIYAITHYWVSRRTREQAQQALINAGNSNVTMHIFPGLDHSFRRLGNPDEDFVTAMERPLDPVMPEALTSWLRSLSILS